MLKTNVDKILELLKGKKSMPISEIANKLKTTKESIQQTAQYLEEDGVLKIEYKFMTPYLTLVDIKKAAAKQEEATEDQDLKVDTGLLDNKLDQPDKSAEDKNYAALDSEEVNEAAFPKEITPFKAEEEEEPEEKKPEVPQTIIIAPNLKSAQDWQPPKQKPELPKEEAKELPELPEEKPEDNPDEEQSSKQERNQTIIMAGTGATLTQIENMIKESNDMIDAGRLQDMSKRYEEAYNEFENLEDVSDEERDSVKKELAKLFARLKHLYTEDELLT